jgi:hypothetical protein
MKAPIEPTVATPATRTTRITTRPYLPVRGS